LNRLQLREESAEVRRKETRGEGPPGTKKITLSRELAAAKGWRERSDGTNRGGGKRDTFGCAVVVSSRGGVGPESNDEHRQYRPRKGGRKGARTMGRKKNLPNINPRGNEDEKEGGEES